MKRDPVHFNLNVMITGMLLAAIVCALGYRSGGDATQWVVPGVIALGSIAAAVLWPGRGKEVEPKA